MDTTHQVETISALEAATDAFLIALGRRPEPDMVAAAAALKAREAALRLLVRTGPEGRPPDLNARLRRILERDHEAADQMRAEMELLRERLADTKKMFGSAQRAGHAPLAAARGEEARMPERVR